MLEERDRGLLELKKIRTKTTQEIEQTAERFRYLETTQSDSFQTRGKQGLNQERDVLTDRLSEINLNIVSSECELTEIAREIVSLTLRSESRNNAHDSKNGRQLPKDTQSYGGVDSLNTRRDHLVSLVPPAFYQRYERIRKARGGIAVVPLQRDSYTACHRILPPQLTRLIRKTAGLHECPYCLRFLTPDNLRCAGDAGEQTWGVGRDAIASLGLGNERDR